jgi:tRNA(Ile)-lysidine synthetase-like protein
MYVHNIYYKMDLLDDFTREWFANPNWWFSKNEEYDNYITSTYNALLETQYISTASPLQTIIIYDQLPRHIYRNHNAAHIIEYYLQKAIDVVQDYIHTSYYETLNGIQWTFFMLPFRHTKNINNIIYVIDETWKRIKSDKNNIDIYKRFLKATYNRLLQDNKHQDNFINITLPQEIRDDDINGYSSHLHYSPNHYNSPHDKLKHNIVFNTTIINVDKPIIISLSGGVDSMVCSFMIKHLYPTANIIAVHISYDNREECDKEILFLKHWCSHLKIVLHIRTISEIHRKPCMLYELRDLYESYTRDVRYNCYRSVVPKNDNDLPQVVMGHNSSDTLENIMTNIAHKNKYDNLYGMSPVSIQDDIMFLRPLLKTSKEEIISFAQHNNIPYLPNSTPVWSQRGQIRNNVVPILDKWNNNYIPSLFNLTDSLSSLHKIMQFAVSQFINKGYFNDNKTIFTIQDISVKELIYEEVFWKEVFIKLFNIYPSLKSLDNFMFSLKKFTSCSDKRTKTVMISKECIFEMEKIDAVFIDFRVKKVNLESI